MLTDQLIPNVRSQHDWEKVTDGWRRWYDKFSKQSSGATDAIIELAQVTKGMQVLDLACGSGEPSLSLARAVSQTGKVTATDIVGDMLHIAEANAMIDHLSNIEFTLADAEAVPFPDGAFDLVTCRFGVMFFSDPVRAMREALRVLKDTGLIVLVTWGPLKDNRRFTTTTSIVEKYLHSAQSESDSLTRTAGNNLFKFAEVGSLSRILREAGFGEISEKHPEIPWIWEGSVEEQFQSFSEMSAPFRRMCSGMDRIHPPAFLLNASHI